MKSFIRLTSLVLPLIFCYRALGDFWVNEINYESSPSIEIVASPSSAGVNLGTVILSLYDGATGNIYASHALSSFTLGATTNDYSLYSLSGFTIQAGNPSGQPDSPDGWAISIGASVFEFRSYEGVFTANSGVAAGLTSTDIGVRQNTGFPTQSSSQLLGTGMRASDFLWIAGQGPSFGQVNLGQTLVAVPEPNSIVLLGLGIAGIFAGCKRNSGKCNRVAA